MCLAQDCSMTRMLISCHLRDSGILKLLARRYANDRFPSKRSFKSPKIVLADFPLTARYSGHSPYELTSVPLVRVKPAFPITRKKRAVKSTNT